MSFVGVVDVLRGKPHNPVGPDGRMALSDHFRELRARLIRSALLLVILFFVAIYFYDQLLTLVPASLQPRAGAAEGQRCQTEQVVNDATGGLLLQMKLCGVVAADRGEPLLALPDLGLHRAGPARQREEVLPDVRVRRRPAVPRRRGAGLLRAAQGPRRC